MFPSGASLLIHHCFTLGFAVTFTVAFFSALQLQSRLETVFSYSFSYKMLFLNSILRLVRDDMVLLEA